jgi:hypothetical protein
VSPDENPVPTLYEATLAFYRATRETKETLPLRRALGAALKAAKPRKPRPQSRADRWSEAAGNAKAALEDLKSVQDEYEEWKGNLPDSLQSSPVGEKLETVTGIDIDGAIDICDEAENADLPLGFGND